ncbi:MAG: ATP synthase subunit C [Candidatus Krumholzibacteriota bacterium]|nr:ATP synthase subunit C [Candidatus Krumholzibacteriota bacterium]
MSLQVLRRRRMKKWITISAGAVFGLVCLVFLLTLTSTAVHVYGQSQEDSNAAAREEFTDNRAKITMWGFVAAAFSTAVGSVGAGIAVGYVGSAALGAIGEKPELAAKALIYVGLAEGIAIYGLIISIMILTKL